MMAGIGKPRLPQFGEAYDGQKLRDLVAELDRFFARVRVDGPLIIGGGAVIDKYFSANKTWDPGEVVDGAQETTTVTVTGARIAGKNLVLAGFNKDLQGMRLTGYVSADDTVTCVLRNDTGGAIDLAEGTLIVGVLRH